MTDLTTVWIVDFGHWPSCAVCSSTQQASALVDQEIKKHPHHSATNYEYNNGALIEYSWIAYPLRNQSIERRFTATAYQVTLDPHINKAPIRAGESA